MQLTDFYYELPEQLIAQYPQAERSASRLLVLNKTTGAIAHRQFFNLIEYLKPGDLLVFNDSKVLPARLFGHKDSGGKVEILIERVLDDANVLAQIRASKAPKPNTQIKIAPDFIFTVVNKDAGLYQLRVTSERTVLALLEQHGHVPLPPYISRSDEASDKTRYQTVYAKQVGSVAAPTAGLHFDATLLQALTQKGIQTAFVTLHVGSGTFQPVRVNNIAEHVMHSEYLTVSPQVCAQIAETKAQGGSVIAVGTTSVRCLETAAQSGIITPFAGETRIFIYPGYQFKCVDAMVTNFHYPSSTLLMLVSAFAGCAAIKRAYAEAVAAQYRFLSYGDAMLIMS